MRVCRAPTLLHLITPQPIRDHHRHQEGVSRTCSGKCRNQRASHASGMRTPWSCCSKANATRLQTRRPLRVTTHGDAPAKSSRIIIRRLSWHYPHATEQALVYALSATLEDLRVAARYLGLHHGPLTMLDTKYSYYELLIFSHHQTCSTRGNKCRTKILSSSLLPFRLQYLTSNSVRVAFRMCS